MNSDFVEWDIKTENSSEHWKHFEVKNKNVLDLGCGRWCVSELQEMSPFYIYNQGANKVVAIDGNSADIAFFLEHNTNKEKIIFETSFIQDAQQIKNLIKEHNIQAIKCDIEGWEQLFYSFTKEDFENISSFAVEYHDLTIKDQFIGLSNEWGFALTAHGKLWVNNMGVLIFNKNKMIHKHNTLKVCIEQKEKIFYELIEARDKIRMLEKLIELNMNDFWDICDQRDWYYEEYQKLKSYKDSQS
jgi:SAM-dependent methyltransferase